MSAWDRIESLQVRHAALEQQLQEEMHRPYPSTETLARIKKEKLRLKDEMHKLAEAGSTPA